MQQIETWANGIGNKMPHHDPRVDQTVVGLVLKKFKKGLQNVTANNVETEYTNYLIERRKGRLN